MRSIVLELTSSEIGLSADPGNKVWGVVMDTGMSDGGWHSLVVLSDGTTSLYTSAAFGIIGAGMHESVRVSSDALLAGIEQSLDLFAPATDKTIPASGTVAIRALTFDGPRILLAKEGDLGHGHHSASPLFYAAQDVITAMRQVTPT